MVLPGTRRITVEAHPDRPPRFGAFCGKRILHSQRFRLSCRFLYLFRWGQENRAQRPFSSATTNAEKETTMDEHSSELLRRWQAGDQEAAEALFRRYFTRLLGLVQTRLSAKMASRFDADDVVQSALKSFFLGAREGRYVLKQAGDLWRLLAGIAMNKMRHAERRHNADKRNVDLEQMPLPLREGMDEEIAWLAREPTPEEAAILVDEMEALLQPLAPEPRRIVELRLQGYTLEEIAQEVRRSQRTVRRTMELVKARLQKRMRRSEES
jgi:RNA polymerase sigma factor (sigma-70 family)